MSSPQSRCMWEIARFLVQTSSDVAGKRRRGRKLVRRRPLGLRARRRGRRRRRWRDAVVKTWDLMDSKDVGR